MGSVNIDELSAAEFHESLLRTVKRQVKAIMEEAVTKKFVHEESEHVLRLSATIQTCLLDRLKKRTAGFLRSNKIANLFNKVKKTIPEVEQLITKIEETESSYESQLADIEKGLNGTKSQCLYVRQLKHVWVRLALTEKLLAKIVQHLVDNSSKYYEKNAILADRVCGQLISSLLVGPCALEYTKMKTSDHYWSDPPADELLQRHKLHSRTNSPGSPGRRPALHAANKYGAFDSGDKNPTNGNNISSSFREYVESLHQNSKSTLLYGKNNVVVQPREEINPIPGYLSLHQIADSLYVKWTPNQLMHGGENNTKDINCNRKGSTDQQSLDHDDTRSYQISNGISTLHAGRKFYKNKNENNQARSPLSYWEYAMSVNVCDIVYLHCHQRSDSRGTLVLVGQDGVQRPPICFPPGGHLLAFLTCLETGLLPHGHLDPPLWSQHGKGKVFPRLRNRSSRSSSSSGSQSETGEEVTDFVFRVTTGNSISSYLPAHIDLSPIQDNFSAYTTNSSLYLSQGSNYSIKSQSRSSLKVLCDTMRRQIISRAFYGWLAHCRHLSTVRTHLSALVLPDQCPIPSEPVPPINKVVWNAFLEHGRIEDKAGLMQHVYFGGVEHSLRKTVWPFLLNHYPLESSPEERVHIDSEIETEYENVMSEWMAAESIVKQREKEIQAAHLAKLSCDSVTSSVSSFDEQPQFPPAVLRKQSSTVNDVFASTETDCSFALPIDGEVDMENEVRENGGVVHGKEERLDRSRKENLSLKKKALANTAGRHSDHTPYSSISTEASLLDRRSSNVTNTTAGESLDDLRLNDILETESSESEDQNYIKEESPHPRRKVVPLQKQTVIDIEANMHKEKNAVITNGSLHDNNNQLDVGNSIAESQKSGASMFSPELLDSFGINLHRIEKDVHRCDRNHSYFAEPENLKKLRNIMCGYVWKHLEIGYMQGMCDLAAPLLIIMDDESRVYSCFTQLMKRMGNNFPNGGAMDSHFANMRSLIQILDSELFERTVHQNGDYTHFYFCYRWFLLDFKRELSYEEDVFAVWERIWAARHVSSEHFVLFFALALLHTYRDIILNNDMVFTDIIKFFNEMAERHDAKKILQLAQNFVFEVQSLISK